MQAVHRQNATISPTNRSAVSNRSRLLDGIDGRSASARRFRDICRAYEAEVGGNISDVDRDLIKQAAALTLRAEQLQADIVNGKPGDDDRLIRLSGTANRILSAIKKRAAKHSAPKPTLRDHIAARRSAPAGAVAD